MILMVAQIIAKDSSTIDLDLRSLKNVEFERYDRQDINLPSHGVVSCNGKATLVDSRDYLISNISSNNISKGNQINLFFKNTKTLISEKIGEFYINSIFYDNFNKIVDIEFSDVLIKLQDVNIDALNYDFESGVSQERMSVVLNMIIDNINDKITGLKFATLDSYTLSHLENNTIPYVLMESTSAWNALNSFAIATQTHIFVNTNGEIVIRYNEGN